MNEKQKSSTSLVLLVLLLLAIPAAMQAQYSYTTNSDGTSITITGYSGPGGGLTIPTNINGLTVNSIAVGAFQKINTLTSATVPDTVTNLGGGAFGLCLGLTNVTIAGSVATIDEEVFHGCTNLSRVTMFYGIASIGVQAFFNCNKLTNVMIPASVTNVGYEAFFNCTSLTAITVPGAIGSSDGLSPYDLLDVFGSEIFMATINNGVTSIASNLFYGLELTNVIIPSSVTSIGAYAFQDCRIITNITIPACVTNIGADAFIGCQDLTSIFFLGDPPAVGSTLFHALQTVYYLPGAIGWSNTFSGCPAVLWNPQMKATGANFGVQNNQFGFDITGTANIPIVVEACANLASPAWTPLQSLTLTNGLFHFSEPLQTNSSGRFYRISSP